MPGRVTAVYILVGLLWIALSDASAEFLFGADHQALGVVQTWKGTGYVLLTAALLYATLRGWAQRHARAVADHAAAARRAEQLFELAPLPMWICDAGGVVLEVNDAACAAFGYTRAALVDQHAGCLQSPEALARVEALRSAPPASPAPWALGALQHRTRAGELVLAETYVSPVARPSGPAFLFALHDVTAVHEAERRLRDTEATFHELLGAMNEVVWIADAETMELLYISPAVERLSGRPASEIVGKRIGLTGVVHEDDADSVVETLHSGRGGAAFNQRVRLRHADGSVRWVDYSGVAVPGADGKPHRVVGIASDVTATRETEAQLRLADRMFLHAREGILVTGPDQVVLRVNPSFTQITGYRPEDIVGKTPRVLASGQHPPEFYTEMWAALRAGGHWQGEVWNRDKAGEVYLEWLSITAIHDDQGEVTHYMAVFTDITTARRSELRIHQLVNYDAVTGLPNLKLFEERVNACCLHRCTDGVGCAVAVLGIDRFKDINDTLGRKVGDAFLAEVAERLRATLEEGDGVARLQGDVFGVHITSNERADHVVRAALAAIARPFDGPDGAMHLTAGAGIASYPAHGREGADLLRHAEAAMFQAKRAGRGQVVRFAPELERAVADRLALEQRVRRAVLQSEFELHFQPQIDLRSLRISGVEALIRWPTPEGMIPPGTFIPLAEESGLILELGRWVMFEACRKARAWADGPNGPLMVAVNISAHQFRQDGFVDLVAAALAEAGLAPKLLELEVTEGVVMDGAERVQLTLQRLRELGVRLSIDDFGTGYSSLAYLRRFPIDKLKIDQSFVREMLHDADAAAVTHAIVELAKTLRLGVIAEGVETEEQAAFLATIGCDEAQGWLYAKAMPSAALEAWRAERSARPTSATPTSAPGARP